MSVLEMVQFGLNATKLIAFLWLVYIFSQSGKFMFTRITGLALAIHFSVVAVVVGSRLVAYFIHDFQSYAMMLDIGGSMVTWTVTLTINHDRYHIPKLEPLTELKY